MINKDIERYENRFSYKKKKENENFTIWYKRFFGGIVDGLFFIMCQQAYISENFTYAETEEIIISYLIFPVAYLIYLLVFEFIFGRSLGKIITQTKVVSTKNKGKLTGNQILIRTICRLIPFDGFSFLSNRPRGWHDSIANTEVIDSPLFKPLWDKYNSKLFFGYLPKKWKRLSRTLSIILVLISMGLAIPIIILLSWIIDPFVNENKLEIKK